MQVVRRTAFKASPWKNGGGVTHEALRVPAEGSHFRWRVSIAEVAQSGPFSEFTGYDRTMMLLRGEGVRLSFEGGREAFLREAGDLVEFDGGVPTNCELLGGPCLDFNLMVARHAGPAQVWVADVAPELLLSPGEDAVQVVFPITEAVNVSADGTDSVVLGAGDLLVLGGGEQVRVTPEDRQPRSTPAVFLAMLRRS